MKIAVCEDVREEADWLCKIIEKWSLEKEIHADVISFSDAASFLFTTEDTVWDILFLDIKMPGEDGIALAKRLRAKEDDIPIVFVTGEKEYMMEGYEVEAVHYLLKPVGRQKVFGCLERIYSKMEKQEPFIILQAEGTMVKLLQKEVYKVEVFSHKLVYTTKKGTYEVSSSMKEARRMLQEDCFFDYLFLLCKLTKYVQKWVFCPQHHKMYVSKQGGIEDGFGSYSWCCAAYCIYSLRSGNQGVFAKADCKRIRKVPKYADWQAV